MFEKFENILKEFENDKDHPLYKKIENFIEVEKSQKSIDRYKTDFFENGMVNLIINPENGEIISANSEAVKFYGYSYDQLVSKKIFEINTLTEKETKDEIKKAKEQDRNYFRFEHKLKNGEIKPVEVYSSPVKIDNKIYLHSIILNIQDKIEAEREIKILKIAQKRSKDKLIQLNVELQRKLNEISVYNEELSTINEELNSVNEELNAVNLKLADERAQFLSLLDTIPEIIYVSDKNSYKILFANKKLKELTGENIIGEECYNVLSNNFDMCIHCKHNHIFETNRPKIWELYNHKLDKNLYIIDKPIKWIDGRDVHFQLAIDITELKKVEKELKRRVVYESAISAFSTNLFKMVKDNTEKSLENGLKSILERSNFYNISIFKNLKKFNNLVAENWISVSEDETFLDKDNISYDKDKFYSWKQFLSRDRSIFGDITQFPKEEMLYFRKLGIKSTLLLPLWVENEWFGFIRFDDKEIRDWEQKDINLFKTISEITGLFIENRRNRDRLLNNNKELKKINNTKNRFFSIIAHDLINPFNGIMGFSDLLLSSIDKGNLKEINEYTSYISKSVESTYKLLENLLNWSRSQMGTIEFNPSNIKLIELFQEIKDLMDIQADKKGVNLHFDINSDITVHGDKNMLNTILRNLISNSIKFTPSGGEVIIKGDQKKIIIKDNGVGIDEKIKNKLFKIDQKVTLPGTDDEKGTGLGLLITKDFLDIHNWSIDIESKKGEGSTFIVKFN